MFITKQKLKHSSKVLMNCIDVTYYFDYDYAIFPKNLAFDISQKTQDNQGGLC